MNGLFGASPLHPAIDTVISLMKIRLQANDTSCSWLSDTTTHMTGTRMFHEGLMMYHAKNPTDTTYIVFSEQQLFPCNVWQDQDKCNQEWRHVASMTHMNDGSWNKTLFTLIKFYAKYKDYIYSSCCCLCVCLILLLLFSKKTPCR
jgi:hypothetical protein